MNREDIHELCRSGSPVVEKSFTIDRRLYGVLSTSDRSGTVQVAADDGIRETYSFLGFAAKFKRALDCVVCGRTHVGNGEVCAKCDLLESGSVPSAEPCIRCGGLHIGLGEVCATCDGKLTIPAVSAKLPGLTCDVKVGPVTQEEIDETHEALKKAQEEIDRPPQLSGVWKSPADCKHDWHKAFPRVREKSCPWCLEDDSATEPIPVVPRCGQSWKRLSDGVVFELVWDEPMRGCRGWFEAKARALPLISVDATCLRDGSNWAFAGGPTDVETKAEQEKRVLRRYLPKRPDGASAMAWEYTLRGVIDEAREHGSCFGLANFAELIVGLYCKGSKQTGSHRR